MKEKVQLFLGMDVHAETIAAALAEPDGEVQSLGKSVPNRIESIRKLIKKLGPVEKLRSSLMKLDPLAMYFTGSWRN